MNDIMASSMALSVHDTMDGDIDQPMKDTMVSASCMGDVMA